MGKRLALTLVCVAGAVTALSAAVPFFTYTTPIASVGKGGQATTSGSINTSGATLITAIGADAVGGTCLSDNQSNTYTSLVSMSASGPDTTVCYKNLPTTSTTHTFTVPNAFASAIAVDAWAGNDTSNPTDNSSAGAQVNPSTTCSVGAFTPAHNNDLVYAGASFEGSSTYSSISSGTISNNIANASSYVVGSAYLVQTTAASYNGQWTYGTSNNGSCIASSFRAAAAAGGTAVPAIINTPIRGGGRLWWTPPAQSSWRHIAHLDLRGRQ